jgi:death-on-curing protein
MKEPIFLTAEDVIYLHQYQIDHYGGTHGVRDEGLLISAVESPKASFGGEFLLQSITEMAASYLYNLVQNHPFLDGNKRAGAVSCTVFLMINGHKLNISDKEFIDLVIKIASGQLKKGEVASELAKHIS